MIYAGYYNLKSASQASSRNTSTANSRRPSEKESTHSVSSTEEHQYQPETTRRPSLLKRALDQLKPLDEPITPTEGIYTPVIGRGAFVTSSKKDKAAKEQKKAEAAQKQKERWANMSKGSDIMTTKENYSLFSAAA